MNTNSCQLNPDLVPNVCLSKSELIAIEMEQIINLMIEQN